MSLFCHYIKETVTRVEKNTTEQIDTLAQVKGYSPTVTESQEQEDGTFVQVEIPNPISKADFIRSVYESMIVNDATNVFSNALRTQMAEQVRIQEEAIRESVQASITSTIE